MKETWLIYLYSFLYLFSVACMCLAAVREQLKSSLFRCVSVTCVGTAIYALTVLPGTEVLNGVMVGYLAVATLFLWRASRLSFSRAAFLLLLVSGYYAMLGSLVENLFYALFELMGYDLYQFEWLTDLIYYSIMILAAVPTYWLLRRLFVPALTDSAIQNWKSLCIMPALFFLVGVLCIVGINDRFVFATLLSLMMLAVYLSTTALTLQLLRKTADEVREAERARAMKDLIQMQGEEYERLRLQIQAARQADHDLRHQYAALGGLLAGGELSAAAAYLREMGAVLPPLEERAYCSRAAVNAVVNHYQTRAEEAGIVTTIQLEIPECRITDSDFCVVIGNLFENAIEACSRVNGASSISIKSARHGDYLLIGVRNTFDSKNWRAENVYYSSKNPGRKGIGLVSIRAVCEKYGGYSQFETDGDFFVSTAAFKI